MTSDLSTGAVLMSGSPAAALVPRPSLGHGCPSPVAEPSSPAMNGPQTGGGVFRTGMSRDLTSGPPALLQREMSRLSFSSMSGLSGEEGGGENRAWKETWNGRERARCAFLAEGANGKGVYITDHAMPMLMLE